LKLQSKINVANILKVYYIVIMYPTVEDLLKTANYITDEREIEIIRKAFEVSQKSHEGHLRKSGEPYFIHCVATAINIANQGMDYETISAGLLHDTLEDTSYTEQEMIRDFGPNITKLVDGVTKLGKVKYTGAERHVESLRKFFIAMSDDIRVVIIKLCDRLHNIQTLEHVDEKKRKRIALETIEIHARLADRLGMGKLKSALEDGAFKYVYPNDMKNNNLDQLKNPTTQNQGTAADASLQTTSQKPKRRRVRTYDKIMSDPFVLTC
jgi:GTP pyrophosphokinase